MTDTRIAYVTCRYPPMRTSGTYRVEAVLRHLPEHGYHLTPVTLPRRLVRLKAGPEAAANLESDPGVLRPSTAFDSAIEAVMRVPYLRRLYREVVLPDTLAPWAWTAWRKVVANLEGVSAIYATSPPYSAMVLADRLARALDVPLIQELRDPPSFDRVIKYRTRAFQRRVHDFEGRYLSRADAVIALTPTMRTRFIELHPGLDPKRVHVVTNGYPDIEARTEEVDRDSGVFTLVYTGTFIHGARGKEEGPFNPAVLLPALEKLGTPSELRIAGRMTRTQIGHLGPASNGSITRILGEVPRQAAISEIAAADIAVIVADDHDWWIGRKVFEYLAFAKRILAILPPGDASDLLQASPKALIVPIGDPAALDQAVQSLHDEWARGGGIEVGEVVVPDDATSVRGIANVLDSVLSRAD